MFIADHESRFPLCIEFVGVYVAQLWRMQVQTPGVAALLQALLQVRRFLRFCYFIRFRSVAISRDVTHEYSAAFVSKMNYVQLERGNGRTADRDRASLIEPKLREWYPQSMNLDECLLCWICAAIQFTLADCNRTMTSLCKIIFQSCLEIIYRWIPV